MDLQTLWFILIAVLFSGYLLLEGFDFGVGMLTPVIGKNDSERSAVIASIAPFWDANEVWLITAGGAMFAAFPGWYATLFSAFYIPFTLLLAALILRGVSFEFRAHSHSASARALWTGALVLSSVLAPLLLGVALANWLIGIPVLDAGVFSGGLADVLVPAALIWGLALPAIFCLHGALFLSRKLDAPLRERAERLLPPLWIIAAALSIGGVLAIALTTTIAYSPWPLLLLGFAGLGAAASGWFAVRHRTGAAFIGTSIWIVCLCAALFAALYPVALTARGDPAASLTIYTASSSAYTLNLMTGIALTLLPFILGYQAWNYWVFRKRLTK